MISMIDTLVEPQLSRSAAMEQIEALLAWLNPPVTYERRSDDRVAMPVLLQLTPLEENGEPVELAALTVVGKNISRRGLSFYHNEPLLYRRAIITVDHAGFDGFSAEIDISWCRFAKPGWYESGGRLLAVAPTEADLVAARRSS
jgi:hypothetical protein